MDTRKQVDAKIALAIAEIEQGAISLINLLETYEVTNVDDAIYKYIALRNHLAKVNKINDSVDDAIKGHQQALNSYLLNVSQDIGVRSFKTDSGSAFRNTKTSYRIRDWDEYSKWILETGNIHCLEKRPAKLAVQEIISEKEALLAEQDSQDTEADIASLLPPGLDLYQEVEFQFRK